MPIKPENRAAYRTLKWKRAAEAVRKRAGGRCEWPGCGAVNHSIGYWEDGKFVESFNDEERLVKIVLTVAHLDHDGHKGNHNPKRMLLLCARHHNSVR